MGNICYLFLILILLSTRLAVQNENPSQGLGNKMEDEALRSNNQQDDKEKDCNFPSYAATRISHFWKGAVDKIILPDYPQEAIQQKIQGQVVISILVDRRGRIVRVCAVSGEKLLEDSAMKAISQWRFKENFGYSKPKKGKKEAIIDEYVKDFVLFNFSLNRKQKGVGIMIYP